MLHRRIQQFFLVYFLGLLSLLLVKYLLNLSDYVIPGPVEIWQTCKSVFARYVFNVLDTLWIAVVGHIISIILAFVVGILGRHNSWIGSLIKATAYSIQAYPIVAVAPIIFILLGDGLMTRLLIAVMICYFPLLLSVIGILSEPVDSIEHFYMSTKRMNWRLQVRIRAYENINKLTTVIAGSATMAVVGTIVAEFIAADAGIGYSIRTALYQSDLSKILTALFLIGIGTSLYLTGLEWVGNVIQKKCQT
ncbi:MAG: ABC transporter permease subunit [Deltaproteobacteria bacterium]|jgi:NitT/TauT family transport system permease protein